MSWSEVLSECVQESLLDQQLFKEFPEQKPNLNKSELTRNQSGWCQQRKQKESSPSIQAGRDYLCLE